MDNKYVDITRLKDKYAEGFTEGEEIVISEKIDGANASILVSDSIVIARSRRNILDPMNNLQGFYEYVQNLDFDLIRNTLGEDNVLFGEWLVTHTVKYPSSKLRKFYVFDVKSLSSNTYLPWKETKRVAETLGLPTVPIFYEGPFKDWDHVYSFVGKTEMDADPAGEGIVIKSQERLNRADDGRAPSYVKIVGEKFSEVHHSKTHKPIDTEKLAERQRLEELAKTIVTDRRIEKILQKFVEDGKLPEDWDEHNMRDIARNLPSAVYEDCVKEEPETVKQIEGFGKICSSITMYIVRNMLNNR